MKKTYLHPPVGAAKITSRRMFGTRSNAHFISTAYKTDGKDEKTEEELLAAFDSRIEKALQNRATKEELEKIKADRAEEFKGISLDALRALVDEKNGAIEMIARQGLEIQRLAKQISQKSEGTDLSIRGQIKSWLESKNDETEGAPAISVKDTILQIRAGKKMDLKPLEIRAANSPMLPSNTYDGGPYLPKPEFAPGIVDVVRPTYTFWNYIKKGATGSAAYVWVNKKVPAGSGAAAFIAPGVYKPGVSFTIETEVSNAKKIAVNEKVAVELLDDIDGMTSWVTDELMYQLYKAASDALMTATASSTSPAGIQTLSYPFAFDTLGLKTTDPNNWDVIRAAVAQLKHGNFVGNVTAFVNPIDYANMVMTKAQNQGQLFIPPVTGATIVEDNNIEVGHVQIAILDYYKILMYKGFTMTWGLENDDFTKNLRTVIAEMRIHQFFSDNHIGCFLYDTFENGIEKLTPSV